MIIDSYPFDFYSDSEAVHNLLEEKLLQYNTLDFVASDPISVPHFFQKTQDIEISGFFSAIFAWGLRKTSINKAFELMRLMDNAPHDFVLNHSQKDLLPLLKFKHRTFNSVDLFYMIDFFKHHYLQFESLEDAFLKNMNPEEDTIENGLRGFQPYFFSLSEFPQRTMKHVSSPLRGSTCKRLNMFLRWMVRKDSVGVDFGIWKRIKPSQLIIPQDLHVARVCKKLKLIENEVSDWKSAMELTKNLKVLDAYDPVKYDFSLFGLGVFEGLGK